MRMPTRSAGLTLIEMIIGLGIVSLLLAVGVPTMADWLRNSRAAAAAEFYTEGFKLARETAVRHNASTRIVLTNNVSNNKMDWQIDLCFASPAKPCSSSTGDWSSVGAASASDPEGSSGARSVLRNAEALPGDGTVIMTRIPVTATTIYYTASGWVDTDETGRLERVNLAPPSGAITSLPSTSVVVNLSGTTTKCNPLVVSTDSRACPP